MAENPAVGKMFTAVVINPTDHYIFALPGEYIFVGMKTGEVSTEP